ncbi:MAG: hypothetical protein LBE83_02655 [Propionibacteriaceae bacterium]|jgi:hypothetical protein|nr:hypothetical protein [Propionibacteriaceae bacterium]
MSSSLTAVAACANARGRGAIRVLPAGSVVSRLFISVVATIMLLFFAGCSSSDSIEDVERFAGSLPELFQQILDTSDPSPVEREAIERAIVAGKIDPADYEAGHVRYAQCMTEHGFAPEYRKTPEGYYVNLGWQAVGEDNGIDQHWECLGDNGLLDSLFRYQQGNPDLIADQRLVAVRCLRGLGLIDAGYTVDDFDRDWLARPGPTFPFDVYEASANNCMYYAGYGVFKDD